MIQFGSRHFAATVTPRGIHLIEYRRGVRRLQVVNYVQDATLLVSPADTAARLGDLLEANGAVGGRLSLAVNGFGTYYQIMSLPAAPPEVLRPVVLRELRHVYPDLRDALVGFSRTHMRDESDKKKGEPREREIQLLVGVVPRDLVSLLQENLVRRGILLEHVTILPRAVQQVHHAFVRSEETVALVLATAESPMLGFFNREGLQFFSSPPGGLGTGDEIDPQPLVEQLERGALFLRQQFRGQRLDRILVASDAAGEPYRAALEQHGGAAVGPVGPRGVPAGALAALGVAIDARSRSAMNLLAPAARPPTEADPWILQLAVLGSVLLVLAAGWWGISGMRAAAAVEERVEAAAVQLSQRGSRLASIQEVVRQRQAHARRVQLLASLQESRTRLAEALWGMEVAPAPVRLDSVQLDLKEGAWTGPVIGTASAITSAQATRALDEWYRGLGRGFPPGAVTVQQLGYPEADSAAAARPWSPSMVDFVLAFKVPTAAETR